MAQPILGACAIKPDNSAEDFETPPSISSLALTEGSSTLAPGDSIRVSWKVTGPNTYHMRFFLSLDAALDDSDRPLGGRNCGPAFEQLPGYDCSGVVCGLQMEMDGPQFFCGDPDSAITKPIAIEPFLGRPVGSATLIGEACNALFNACDVATIGLELGE
ncbi:MAG TPA: hypothetical protein VJN18_16650 [Polyangiaceae bacterium]|nr:hypothetical protein [Polyangiaceae bacterium]